MNRVFAKLLVLSFATFFSVSSIASAKNCVKGKACGNACIAKNDVCHKGEASAPAAAPAAGIPAAAPAPAETAPVAAKAPKECKKGKPCGNTCIPQKAVCHS